MLRLLILAGLGVAFAARPARADAPDPGIATYALVVGSNTGGPGQTDLRYSEDDAHRVAATLIELGGYPATAVDILVHPTPESLREHLGALGTKVQVDIAAGRQVRVLFYYSGHARSTAIDLGRDEMPLDELRQRLYAVPATLTVVVLDACQSGAFSQVKGATAATDFSISSKQHLDATGIAVLASSSGSEYSQESKELRSSYFTYNLLIGLRGAADTDHDGAVTIDEAYRYGYNQTLLATAGTAVGSQHPVLQVDLKGHGQIPLSYPRAATAAIVLPARLEGKTTVEDTRAHAVIAETFKARGAPVRIAVAPGQYNVIVRGSDKIYRCPTSVTGDVNIDLAQCTSEPLLVEVYKGGDGERTPGLRVELTGALGDERKDDYTRTLLNFGLHDDAGLASRLALLALWQLDRRLWVGGLFARDSAPGWDMPISGSDKSLSFNWNTYTVGAVGRAVLPFGASGLAARSGVFAQFGVGLGIGSTSFVDQDMKKTSDTFYGWAATFGAGLHVDGNRGIGFSLGYEYDYAPIIDNLTGDTHASGGHRFFVGISYAR